ncbi:hypothetical protein NSB25_09170 [Acetatifactor muris]|uniref:beta-galactosidase n=1 Tax=Acetatifactor muris TaxID=879566 RepID=A0A2K4ZA56_9FIRM|nr:glycoside hydrolase family 2 TIM barrel-domain containing protein [Acetatifactor muris]MCI8800257.1 hypothetical protein [Lachnospiraceae bacterium]MCR2047448.1 hypothetical protein [Acetatifactor muris]SOY27343.1 Evolved beta-galactosidase subunit alpha [Acetatifactor muris]
MQDSKVVWERPVLHPLPEVAEGLCRPMISLNGEDWKINRNPGAEFWREETVCRKAGDGKSGNDWQVIRVPAQVNVGEQEYAYEKILEIPPQWEGKRIFLRFDGVNCLARVFVDGVFVRSHYGGFVSWDCEITERVKAGGKHRLVLGVTDRPKEVCSFHQGGIIRDVLLYALPQVCLSRLQVSTAFDGQYENAELAVEVCAEGKNSRTEEASVEYLLTTPDREVKCLGEVLLNVEERETEEGADIKSIFPVKSPKKWDSEHPWLYTLTAVLRVQGRETERVSRQFGFRQIEKRGNQVFLNGDELKLRGINHHDIDPLTGRSITGELAEEDVRLFKEANINFIRTSHYPPRPDFLDLCDRYGIYVEDEIAVAFLGYGTKLTQDDPAYREHYLGQFSEMVERDKSHPCVIIWSLANESYWGENHGQCLAWARQEDPGRLTVFSYPMTQKDDEETTDLWSVHYASWDSHLADRTECFRRSFYDGPEMPVIHDESTHIPCYDSKALARDQGIRDFWGETISRFWERIWETKGALGCAVWAGIDDVTVQDGILQGRSWGIIDGWRRKKPEYWHIRKGYSPIVVRKELTFGEKENEVHLYNRFNHTNLEEVTVEWRCGKRSGKLMGPKVGPGEEEILKIPVLRGPEEKLELKFTDPFGFTVEECCLSCPCETSFPAFSGKAPVIERIDLTEMTSDVAPVDKAWMEAASASDMKAGRKKEKIIVKGQDFRLIFSEETGLVEAGYYKEELVLTGGPCLHLVGLDLEPWTLNAMEVQEADDCVRILLQGAYGGVEVCFVLRIDGEGLMEAGWNITRMPYPSPRRIAVTGSIISHAGGYDEAGISFTLAEGLDTLTWKRQGLWDVYPDWHIGRLEGTAKKHAPEGEAPIGQKPVPGQEWKDQEADSVQFGRFDMGRRGTRDFASMKSYVTEASLKNDKAAFTLLSDGTLSVRMELLPEKKHLVSDRDPEVRYHGNWIRRENRYHSFGGTETWSKDKGDWCEYTFQGTGIAWYSSLDRICGRVDIYIDGELREQGLDLGCVQMGKNPRGYSKGWKYLAYSIRNLPLGQHTIRLEVTGEPAEESHNCYVNVDAFLVLDGKEEGDTRFIVNRDFNYPEISWADYCKPPVRVETGYEGKVYVKLGES